MSAVEALFTCNLAPLCSRRDMAMLGLIHRTMLGAGPPQFQAFFRRQQQQPQPQQPAAATAAPSSLQHPQHQLANGNFARHSWQLVELSPRPVQHDWLFSLGVFEHQVPQYLQHSCLGLVSIYNMLPSDIVLCSPTVDVFQSKLQELLRTRAADGHEDWPQLLSPRRTMEEHPLQQLRMQHESSS